MTAERATYRYFTIFIPAMIIYAAATEGIALLPDSNNFPDYVHYALALISIVAIFFVFWAHWRFAIELDEFLRLIQIKATLFAIGCVLIIVSGWGQLERLADAATLPVFWLLPIFWAAQGLATLFFSIREDVF